MRKMLKKIYLSVAAYPLSFVVRLLSWYKQPRMIYGFVDPTTGKFRKHTRVSDSVKFVHKKHLSIGDHVWLGDYIVIDASAGISIGEGCQIGAFTAIYSHSSHASIRLYGRKYIYTDIDKRIGYLKGRIAIGEYTFIATCVCILSGVSIGKGCVIAAGTVLKNGTVVPDFSIVAGLPAKIIGDTRNMDVEFIDKHPELADSYFDLESYQKFIQKEKGE